MYKDFANGRTPLRWILTAVLMMALMLGTCLTAIAQPADITGTWAEQQINNWIDKGLVQGYPDGTFKPDANVTRAEFVVMTNRAFGFSASEPTQYIDVTSGDWFAQDISKAKTAGYVSGYPDGSFQPNDNISRQEAAAILNNLKKLSVPSEEVINRFSDSPQIPAWSRGAISAVVSNGLMNGYPDQTFKAMNSITRAEAVVTLNNAMQEQVKPPTTVVYDKAGKYGPASGSETVAGNVNVSVSGVTLQNTTISGDLILDEGIGSGEVNLKNVVVQGETFVKGGGSNSVVMTDCTFGKITVSKAGVRVAIYGNTTFDLIVLNSSAALELDSTADFDSELIVSEVVPAGTTIRLGGNFDKVAVNAADIDLLISSGTLDELEVSDSAQGTNIDLTDGVRVIRLVINAPVDITGEGDIETAVVMVEGVSIEQEPLNIENPNDVIITIAGRERKGTGTGGGNAPLNLVFSDPSSGSTGVPVDVVITFTFDRGVVRDYWDINQDCFSMEDEDNNSVDINVSRADNYLDEDEKRNIYVTPSSELDYGTTYTVTIDGGLTANNGNIMGDDETIRFTTDEGSGGGDDDEDLSAAEADLAAAGSKSAGSAFSLSITGAKDAEGVNLNGAQWVTVSSNLDGQVFNGDVSFSSGTAAVAIPAGKVITAGTNTLTITIAGVTPHPSVAVTVVAGTQISSANSDVDIDTALAKGSTSIFTITLRDAYNNIMANQSKNYKIVVTVTDNDATTDESYTVDGTPVAVTSTLSRSGAFDSSGQRNFSVVLPGTIDTGDGIAIQVTQNNDTLIGSSFSFTESASDFSAAEVGLAEAGNKTAGASFALSITGAKDMAGTDLTGTKTVTVNSDLDGQVFSADVTFAAGAASVTIAAGEVTTAGTNTLTVTIAGVTPQPSVAVTVVTATQISSANSDVDIDTALAKGSTSTITITLRDAYNNVMAGQTKNYKIAATITNNDATTAESYTVDGSAVTATTTLTRSGLFDSNGQRSFIVTLPAAIDSGDEISIQVTQNNDSPIGGSFTYTEEMVDLSDAGASLAVAGPKTAGTTFNLNITGAQDSDGVNLSGTITVTVTSDLDGEVYGGNVIFTGGSATVVIPVGQVTTAGTNTLTISIAGVTPQPEVVVTVTAATQIDADNSDVDIDTALDKGNTSTITITLRDAYNNVLANISKNYKIVVTVTNDDAAMAESYTVDGTSVTSTNTLSRNGTFDSDGQRSFSVTLPAAIDPGDGISIQVTQNNDTLLGGNFDYQEP